MSSASLVAERFSDWKQQRETSSLGMWVFLASEVLFFGSLLGCYAVYRAAYPEAFRAAAQRTDIVLGTLNTAVLLTSSFTMALAVSGARLGSRKLALTFLLMTGLLGVGFLGIKGYEYYHDWQDHLVPGSHFEFSNPPAVESGLPIKWQSPPTLRDPSQVLPSELPSAASATLTPSSKAHVQLFFVLYFFLTGLHALHLTIAIGWLAVTSLLLWRQGLPDGQPVEVLGLYWHFVDLVWVFLYPLLYLAGRSLG